MCDSESGMWFDYVLDSDSDLGETPIDFNTFNIYLTYLINLDTCK